MNLTEQFHLNTGPTQGNESKTLGCYVIVFFDKCNTVSLLKFQTKSSKYYIPKGLFRPKVNDLYKKIAWQ